jgi:hypothetical protein
MPYARGPHRGCVGHHPLYISGDGVVIVNSDNHGGIGMTFGGKKHKKK